MSNNSTYPIHEEILRELRDITAEEVHSVVKFLQCKHENNKTFSLEEVQKHCNLSFVKTLEILNRLHTMKMIRSSLE